MIVSFGKLQTSGFIKIILARWRDFITSLNSGTREGEPEREKHEDKDPTPNTKDEIKRNED